MMNAIEKKNTGSFYTCNAIADYIACWAINAPDISVLEPSFGDGIFLNSALSRYSELGNENPNITGVELQETPFKLFMQDNPKVSGFNMDYLDFWPQEKVGAVIGNPPYVSLKKLNANDREKAIRLVSNYGVNMHSSSSLWMPFIIHSTEMLQPNGKLGFVLPYEITHVRYSFDLWKYLSDNYGKITICRLYNDFFPDVDVETVIFLAEQRGLNTDCVHYIVYKTIEDLYSDNAYISAKIAISDILNVDKPFERELLPLSITGLMNSLRHKGKFDRLVRDCKFKIGYVSGNKGYFHLSRDDVDRLNIIDGNTKKCLLNAKQISANEGIGIETGGIQEYSLLFYPSRIEQGEKDYIAYGESLGVNNGYKCKVRKPWYITPGLEVPDIVLTVFGDVPKLLLNNGGFYVSNSLLSGFSRVDNPKELICRWYNSLTLLSIEVSIHSLGGGTLVLIPGETDKLEVISDFPADRIEDTYKAMSDFARTHPIDDVYKHGDSIVLKEIYGFTDVEIEEIRNALLALRNWRNPEKRRG